MPDLVGGGAFQEKLPGVFKQIRAFCHGVKHQEASDLDSHPAPWHLQPMELQSGEKMAAVSSLVQIALGHGRESFSGRATSLLSKNVFGL